MFDFMRYWRLAGPLILLMTLLAGKAYRPLLVAALVNIVIHQLIGHKEWRYLWFSSQILLILAAIGSVNLARMTLFGRRLARPGGPGATAGIILLWGAASLWLSTTDTFRLDWRTSGEPSRLAALAARDPRVCGLAVNRRQNVEYGYAFVHRRMPVYLLNPASLPSLTYPGRASEAFNAVLANTSFAPPAGFPTRVACGGTGFDRVCLHTRPGGCAANASSAAIEHQAALLKTNM
jgi:hypothetical protein